MQLFLCFFLLLLFAAGRGGLGEGEGVRGVLQEVEGLGGGAFY